MGSDDDSSYSVWVDTESNCEHWTLMLKHVLCMNVLKKLPGGISVCYTDFLNSGRGFYREMIGKWAAEFDLDPLRLYTVIDDPLQINDSSQWEVVIGELMRLFPVSIRADMVLCDCAWECMNVWRQSKDLNGSLQFVEKALSFVDLLQCSRRLQHGISLLLWVTFFRQPMKYIYDFLNKMSQYQTKLHCKVDLQKFPCLCTKLLSLMRTSLSFAEPDDILIDRNYEEIEAFEDFVGSVFKLSRFQKIKAKEPLSVLARKKKPVNYDMVLHHHNLAMVIELQMTLEEWPPTPKSYFDSLGDRAFFESFHLHPLIPLDKVSESLKAKRHDFLEKCMSHAGSDEFSKDIRLEVLDLICDWKLNGDEIRMKEIVSLYEKGNDLEAQHLIIFVENRGLLPYKLFDVLVARIRKWMDTSEVDLYRRAQRAFVLDNSIKKCLRESDLEVATVSVIDILSMIKQIKVVLGSVAPNDRVSETATLLNKFQKLVECIN